MPKRGTFVSPRGDEKPGGTNHEKGDCPPKRGTYSNPAPGKTMSMEIRLYGTESRILEIFIYTVVDKSPCPSRTLSDVSIN